MEPDDVERRIADLERELAQPRHPNAAGASTPTGSLAAEQVHNVAFSKPPLGKRGYNEDEVDAFLELVEATLRDPGCTALTAQQVRDVAFSKPPVGRRGYNEDEVDAFLDFVAGQLAPQQGAAIDPALTPPTSGADGLSPQRKSWVRRLFG